MDGDDPVLMNGLDEAAARLAEMEQSQAAEEGRSSKPATSAKPDATRAASTGQPAQVPPKTNLPPGDKPPADKTGTPSAADPNTAAGKKPDDKGQSGQPSEQAKPTDDKGSKFAKDRERRDRTWKELNAEKEAHQAKVKADTDKVAADRQQLEAERAAFQRERDQAEAGEKPESYEAYANNQQKKVDELLGQAKAAEEQGDFDKAEKLREQAAEARAWVNSARRKAQDLREHPPANQQQRQQANALKTREWMLKAATDFPDFGKAQSETQKKYVEFAQRLQQLIPAAVSIPELTYYVVEHADLALQRDRYKTAADRVPALEKELGELKTKLTELEALTNPAPGGGAQGLPAARDFSQLSGDEQFAQLQREARELGG